MTNRVLRFLPVIAVLSLNLAAQATLYYPHGNTIDRRVMQQYGTASDNFGVILKASGEEFLKAALLWYNRHVMTEVKVTYVKAATYVNISCEVQLEGYVGYTSFKLFVLTRTASGYLKKYKMRGSYDVLGIQFRYHRHLASGDTSSGVKFSSYIGAVRAQSAGGLRLRALAHAGHGRYINVDDAKYSVRDFTAGSTSKFLLKQGVKLYGKRMIIKPRRYRVTKGVKIVVDMPSITLHGESAETEVVVNIGDYPSPPPVLSAYDMKVARVVTYSKAEGKPLCVDMFNAYKTHNLRLLVGRQSTTKIHSASSFGVKDQTVCFDISSLHLSMKTYRIAVLYKRRFRWRFAVCELTRFVKVLAA